MEGRDAWRVPVTVGGGRMMTVGLHERWSGQAGRATAVRDFTEYVRSRHAEWDSDGPWPAGGQHQRGGPE